MMSYFLTIPLAAIIAGVYWYTLITTEYIDAIPAWIIAGIIANGALIGIIYHCYRTVTGTWKK